LKIIQQTAAARIDDAADAAAAASGVHYLNIGNYWKIFMANR
jgi:hypothetical protein